MSDQRRILIVNDDGIDAEGIRMLASAARAFGRVWVIAPDGQRSAMSHRISTHDPVKVTRVAGWMEDVEAYACTGTPADCVRISEMLIGHKPDVVLSGINYGYNMGGDLQYSATAGAALEGAFQGMHAIAFSQGMEGCREVTEHYLSRLIGEYIDRPLNRTHIWNINLPTIPLSECKGILRDVRVCYDSVYYEDYSDEQAGPDSHVYRIVNWNRGEPGEGTDMWGIWHGYVTVGTVSNLS